MGVLAQIRYGCGLQGSVATVAKRCIFIFCNGGQPGVAAVALSFMECNAATVTEMFFVLTISRRKL